MADFVGSFLFGVKSRVEIVENWKSNGNIVTMICYLIFGARKLVVLSRSADSSKKYPARAAELPNERSVCKVIRRNNRLDSYLLSIAIEF